jgi:hypothetical protein
VYGSHDGGASVHASDAAFNSSMKCLAQQLNIAEHLVFSEVGVRDAARSSYRDVVVAADMRARRHRRASRS